ncbi:hypothetical protein RND71_034657 [Anisodus tanguticus]|uniref:GTPase Der n=1 Tax=Anisodus tanguticus TaxID=243964 RepID=A0AAE1R3Z3_9SOLA|nr:hypothetical protein RND71_034657 [Anisodus tanguticus]
MLMTLKLVTSKTSLSSWAEDPIYGLGGSDGSEFGSDFMDPIDLDPDESGIEQSQEIGHMHERVPEVPYQPAYGRGRDRSHGGGGIRTRGFRLVDELDEHDHVPAPAQQHSSILDRLVGDPQGERSIHDLHGGKELEYDFSFMDFDIFQISESSSPSPAPTTAQAIQEPTEEVAQESSQEPVDTHEKGDVDDGEDGGVKRIALGQESAHELFDNRSSLLGQRRANELLDNVKAATNSDRGVEAKHLNGQMIDFTQIHINKLPTVLIMGRPNVGKSALFNRLIRRREALVYNTPTDHVTRDIREGVAKLGNLRFRVLDSAGIEAEASSGSVLRRTAEMTRNVLSRTQLALLLVDARDGVLPMDLDVGKWLRKNAPGMKTIVVMNKAESLDDCDGTLAAAAGEAYNLGFGDPIALSAETGLGMAELHETLRPLLEEYVVQNNLCDDDIQENDENDSSEDMECKLPLQLAIVGRPNVGKSTLLNTILQEDRVLVGPEAGLTRDSIRAEFQYEGRTVYLVDTAGWLERTKQQEKGPASLSIMQSRKHLMRAHVIVLVLDAEEIAKDRRSMKHVEVVIARRAVEEGRGLVVIVNKMDLLRGKENSKFYKSVIEAVPQEIQTVIPQVTGIPVVFVSALEGKSQIAVMNQVVETYEKWCLRLPTARLNRWLRKVMSRHSWKDQAAQPKIKYFTQVKARPPTFIAFMSGKTQLSDTDFRFLTRSLKEDFDLGGIPVRILQRTVEGNDRTKTSSKNKQSTNKTIERAVSDKRTILEGDQLDKFGVSF